MSVLNRTLSQCLSRYYLGPDHPGKLRLVNAFFRATSARLQVPYAERGWITLDPTDGVQDSILRYGYYEKEVWDALAALARGSDIVWDVGSNIGGIGIRAALDERIKEVHCFEPHPQTLGVLKANIECNPGRPLRAHALALSDKEETRSIYSAGKDNSGASSLNAREGGGPSFDIVCSTIDRVIEKGIAPAPTLVKIDVEGWEMSVLRGGTDLFAKTPPRALVIEATADAQGNLTDNTLRDFMQGHGYRIEHIVRGDRKVEAVENYLFVHGK